MADKPVIEVEHLRRTYGETVAVEDISLEVRQSEIFGVIGPNGAGKTTFVECVQGLRHAESGTIRVLGLDPNTHGAALRRRVGSQLQESALPDRIRVKEALELFASFARTSANVDDLIRTWGLWEKRNTAFNNLSGGQQQRLFIALALVNKPDVVFLDEMTTGLDPAARRVAWDLIETVRAQGTTVVLVTHFMDEAERLCDRLAIIQGGKVAALGTPQGLIEQYAGDVRVLFTTEEQDLAWLSNVPFVSGVTSQAGRVEVTGRGPVLAHVGAALVEKGIAPPDLRVERPTLEDVYLRVTESDQRVEG